MTEKEKRESERDRGEEMEMDQFSFAFFLWIARINHRDDTQVHEWEIRRLEAHDATVHSVDINGL